MRTFGLTAERQDEVWRRWRAGESLRAITRSLGLNRPATVRSFVASTGGVRQPPPRRDVRHLTLEEREEISRGVAAGEGCRALARRLGRSPSTVSREVQRNGGRRRYRAQTAEAAAARRAARPKRCLLVQHPRLREQVERGLEQGWSPQQIAARLVVDFPDDPTMRVSHETIYLTLFVQARGGLRRELARDPGRTAPRGRGHLNHRLRPSEPALCPCELCAYADGGRPAQPLEGWSVVFGRCGAWLGSRPLAVHDAVERQVLDDLPPALLSHSLQRVSCDTGLGSVHTGTTSSARAAWNAAWGVCWWTAS